MKSKCASLVLFIILLSACVSTKAVKLGTATAIRPPVPWSKVAVFRSADQIPGKYEEVGLLMATGDTMWTSEAGLWKSLQRKAGKMGANGVILDALSEPKAGTKVLAAALFGMGADRKGKAIAIYVFPPENK